MPLMTISEAVKHLLTLVGDDCALYTFTRVWDPVTLLDNLEDNGPWDEFGLEVNEDGIYLNRPDGSREDVFVVLPKPLHRLRPWPYVWEYLCDGEVISRCEQEVHDFRIYGADHIFRDMVPEEHREAARAGEVYADSLRYEYGGSTYRIRRREQR